MGNTHMKNKNILIYIAEEWNSYIYIYILLKDEEIFGQTSTPHWSKELMFQIHPCTKIYTYLRKSIKLERGGRIQYLCVK